MRAAMLIAAATMLLCAEAKAYAQDAVPGEILFRTMFIAIRQRSSFASKRLRAS
jgi:hypothetical protein